MINLKLIAIIATLTTVFGFGVMSGYKWQQGKIDDLKADHAQQIAQIEAEAERDLKERQDHINHLQKEFAIADSNYLEAMKHAQDEINKRDICIRNGSCLPTVKVKCPVLKANGKDSDTKGVNEATYAELDTETAISSFGVTDDGDKIIRQLTELQNRVRELTLVCPIEII